MPLDDIGGLILSHALFVLNLYCFHLALSDADPSLVAFLYVFAKLCAKRGDAWSEPPPVWPKWWNALE